MAVYNGQTNAASDWYQQDGCFDANGNLGFQSYAYQNSGFNQAKHCSASAGDTYSYDALGRMLSIAHADGTSINYTYTGRATQVTDENNVTRISQVDGMGRLVSVCEVSNSTQQGVAPVACGQDIAANGFLTTYAYSTDSSKDQVTTITQGAQTRTTVTDSLGRTVSVTEPERGTTTYSYAYSTTAGLGLTVTRKRPQANQSNASVLTTTTTQYDSLGRVVSISYTDKLTPTKKYSYDVTNWSEASSQHNYKGRLSLAWITGTPWAGTLYSYDAMGRVTDTWQCTPSGCGNKAYDKHTAYTYDWAGNLTSEWDPAAGNITYGRSPAGELTSVTNNTYTLSGSSGTSTLLSNPTNGPNGPISYNFGNGLSQYNSYDSLGRLNGGWVCAGAPSGACSNPNVPQRNGFYVTWSGSRAINSGENYVGQGMTYQYDDFNRLTGMKNSAGTATYSYVYDRYGNRWQQNALQGGAGFSQSYSAATNQLSSGGYQYDAAGNMTYDASGGHHFTYDAEGNILQVDAGSWTFVFDALNHRVRAQASGVLSEGLYDIAGRITSGWSGPTTPSESHIFADSLQIAFRSGDGNTYFTQKNWLNTDRVTTDLNGNTGATYTSLPFGDGGSENVSESYAGWDFEHFGDMDVDSWDSTYHAQFRNYSELQARWLSPDPYDGSYDLSNPQSFNRYAYVLNNPLSFIDPNGLDCYQVSGGDWSVSDGTDTVSGSDPTETVCTDYGGDPTQGGKPVVIHLPHKPIKIPLPPIKLQTAPSKGPSKTACFLRGAAVGAGGALLIGGAAIGAVALGAPAAVVTGVLLVGGAIGGGATLYSAGSNIANGNYAAAAYDVGSLAGGAVAGGAVGGAVGDSINPPASRGWSFGGDWANRFNPGLGSIGKWLGTGPDAAAAGGSTAAGSSGLAGFLGGPC